MSRGDRIAQLVIQRFEDVEWHEVADARRHRARARRLGFDRLPLTGSPARMADRPFRFGVIARSKCGSGKEFTELGAPGRGARLLDAVRPRPLRRPRSRADRRARARRGGHRHLAGRTARARQRLQAPGRPRARDGDARPALRRAARARHRRGLDDRRLREGGDAARSPRCAHRAARRVDHDPEGPVRRRAVHVPRRALPRHRARRHAEAGAAQPTRRSSSAGAAARSSASRRARRRSSASMRTCAPAPATSPEPRSR